MASSLCQFCSAITLSMILKGYEHPFTYNEINQFQDDCSFCRLVAFSYDNLIGLKFKNVPPTWAPLPTTLLEGKLKWQPTLNDGKLASGHFRLNDRIGPHIRPCVAEGIVDSSLNETVQVWYIQPADSGRNYRYLREWLHRCDHEHEPCRIGISGDRKDDLLSSTELPTRVIDVGATSGTQEVRLLETEGFRGKYMTLSHRWSVTSLLQTKRANVDSFHTRIPTHLMTQTYHDAIIVVRQLGIRYLWIDSLCIIQDDAEDLGREIARMGTIFENSYCTIAAVDARSTPDLDGGLFLPHIPDCLTATLSLRLEPGLDMPPDISDQPAPIRHLLNFRTFLGEEHYGSENVQNKAWYHRGWVFQEIQLSRRMIFYTSEFLAWTCSMVDTNERRPNRKPRSVGGLLRMDSSSNKTGDMEESVLGQYEDVHYRLRRQWEFWVSHYTSCSLTFASDKEKAIQGICNRLNSRFKTVFHFGLLETNLGAVFLQQLLWYANDAPLLPCTSFPCPSWSWMSYNGQITYADVNNLQGPESLCSLSICDTAQSLPSPNQKSLHFSGKVKAQTRGVPLTQLPDLWVPITSAWQASDKNREPQPRILVGNQYGFGDLEENLGGRITTLIDSNGETVGWISIDADEFVNKEVVCAVIQQWWWIGGLTQELTSDGTWWGESEDEVINSCIDFLALSQVPTDGANNSSNVFRRVGRGRVTRSTDQWCGECKHTDAVIV